MNDIALPCYLDILNYKLLQTIKDRVEESYDDIILLENETITIKFADIYLCFIFIVFAQNFIRG